jgi:cytochrome c oxidase cbb3-type subunit IV
MDLGHATLVWFSIALSIITVVYAYWPSNKKAFDRAAKSVLHNEDRPWR